MANIIMTNADYALACKFHDTGSCYYESNGDDTYTVFYTDITMDESHPFGYKFTDSDDLRGVQNAWISPSGAIYYVFWHGHNTWARVNKGMWKMELENQGWAHYSYGGIVNDHTRFSKACRESIAYLFMANDKNADLWLD